jgi:hypothetical protein
VLSKVSPLSEDSYRPSATITELRASIPAGPFVILVADNPLDAALMSPLQRTSATVLQHRKYDFREQILTILLSESFVAIPASNLLKSPAQQPI